MWLPQHAACQACHFLQVTVAYLFLLRQQDHGGGQLFVFEQLNFRKCTLSANFGLCSWQRK
jgi:hypothetical protein